MYVWCRDAAVYWRECLKSLCIGFHLCSMQNIVHNVFILYIRNYIIYINKGFINKDTPKLRLNGNYCQTIASIHSMWDETRV